MGEIRIGNEVYQLSKYIPDLRIESCVFGNRRQVWRGEWEISCEQSGLKAVLNFSEVKRATGWFGGGDFVNEVSGFVWSAKVINLKFGPVFFFSYIFLFFFAKDEKKVPLATFAGLAGERVTIQRQNKERVILDVATLTTQEIQFMSYNQTPPNDSRECFVV